VYDQVLFGLTSAISLIVVIVMLARLTKPGGTQRALWAISFAILCVVAAGVALYGLGFLSQPFVNPVSSLISGLFAAGLLWAWKRRVGSYYLPYTLAAFVVLLGATLVASAPPVLFAVFIHAPSGLVIFLLPLYMVLAKKTKWSGAMASSSRPIAGTGAPSPRKLKPAWIKPECGETVATETESNWATQPCATLSLVLVPQPARTWPSEDRAVTSLNTQSVVLRPAAAKWSASRSTVLPLSTEINASYWVSEGLSV
jgi:hypothetical protein